jgi:uncharacterized protein (TIGR03086 family)
VLAVTATADPRPLFRRAHAWVQGLLDGVRPEQLDLPTPCSELDVRALAGHLVATVRKLTAMGRGGDKFSAPFVIRGIPDEGFAEAYAAAARALWTVWDEDAVLTATVHAPWGDVPGSETMWGYLNETLVHGWDLALATDQDPEADPEIVYPALAVADRILPAEPRGDQFAPVVDPAAGAGLTERLANWSGRKAGAR